MPGQVTLFADFTCPFCYVTEAALQLSAASADVRLVHRAVERFPIPPRPAPAAEPGWRDEVAPLAAELGLPLGDPPFRPGTGKAHEAARWAAERGAERAMREAIYRAYWGDALDIGRIDVLQRIAESLGLDATELKISLDIDQHAAAVHQDVDLAHRLRIPALPTLFLTAGSEPRILIGLQTRGALDEALASR